MRLRRIIGYDANFGAHHVALGSSRVKADVCNTDPVLFGGGVDRNDATLATIAKTPVLGAG